MKSTPEKGFKQIIGLMGEGRKSPNSIAIATDTKPPIIIETTAGCNLRRAKGMTPLCLTEWKPAILNPNQFIPIFSENLICLKVNLNLDLVNFEFLTASINLGTIVKSCHQHGVRFKRKISFAIAINYGLIVLLR